MSKLSNTLTMLEYLSSGRKYTIKELSDKLEVSERMIRIYKDDLEKAGIYIDTIKGPYGGYVLNQNVSVPKRFIIPKEIRVERGMEVFVIAPTISSFSSISDLSTPLKRKASVR